MRTFQKALQTLLVLALLPLLGALLAVVPRAQSALAAAQAPQESPPTVNPLDEVDVSYTKKNEARLTGELVAVVVDNINAPSAEKLGPKTPRREVLAKREVMYYVQDAAGKLTQLSGNWSHLAPGSSVSIQGHLVKGELRQPSDVQVLEQAQSFAALGNGRALAIIINFQDLAHLPQNQCTIARLNDIMFNHPDSTHAFYSNLSDGGITFSGDTIGPLTIPFNNDANCRASVDGVRNYRRWSDAALDLASTQVNIESYDHILFIFPKNLAHCTSGAFANVNGPYSWYFLSSRCFDDGMKFTVSHELGHNLGMHHSNAIEQGQSYEYNDYTEVMNSSYLRSNAPHMVELGLQTHQTVSGDGTYQLRPLHNGTGTEILRIDAGSTPYYVSYRVPTGWDADYWDSRHTRYEDRMLVHQWGGDGQRTQLLHYAAQGDHFIANGLRIDHVALTGGQMEVLVDFDPAHVPMCVNGDGLCPGVYMCSPATDSDCTEEPIHASPGPDLSLGIAYDPSSDAIIVAACNAGVNFTAPPLFYNMHALRNSVPCYNDPSSRFVLPSVIQDALEQGDCYTVVTDATHPLIAALETSCNYIPGESIDVKYAIDPDATIGDIDTRNNQILRTIKRVWPDLSLSQEWLPNEQIHNVTICNNHQPVSYGGTLTYNMHALRNGIPCYNTEASRFPLPSIIQDAVEQGGCFTESNGPGDLLTVALEQSCNFFPGNTIDFIYKIDPDDEYKDRDGNNDRTILRVTR